MLSQHCQGPLSGCFGHVIDVAFYFYMTGFNFIGTFNRAWCYYALVGLHVIFRSKYVIKCTWDFAFVAALNEIGSEKRRERLQTMTGTHKNVRGCGASELTVVKESAEGFVSITSGSGVFDSPNNGRAALLLWRRVGGGFRGDPTKDRRFLNFSCWHRPET